MQLQRFVGKDTKSVMEEIRTSLGDGALIVSNTRVGSKTEIIAACENVNREARANSDAGKISPEKESQQEKFSELLADESIPSPWPSNDDPWEHIRKINKEISSIKSALQENSAKGREEEDADSVHSGIYAPKAKAEINEAFQILDSASAGSFIVWGEKKSGKSFVIKELIKRRAENHKDTIILRLPHTANADDSHLCRIAERFSLNVSFINDLGSMEFIFRTLVKEHLVLIEADLELLANLALDNEAEWLQASSNFIIDEDEKQSELIFELFKQINAKIPQKIDAHLIKEIS